MMVGYVALMMLLDHVGGHPSGRRSPKRGDFGVGAVGDRPCSEGKGGRRMGRGGKERERGGSKGSFTRGKWEGRGEWKEGRNGRRG
jgi:hypothetical protein